MSRLGKKPIIIPDDVAVKVDNGRVVVTGPQGELERNFKDSIKITVHNKMISLIPVKTGRQMAALWGTCAAHLKNMVEGVKNGFSKNLIIEGIGYKAQIEGNNLVLNLGFSHPIKMSIPKGIEIKVEKNKIQVSGVDKEKVGQVSAQIRALKKPEPYKGKGIRYENEIIRRKAGKKAVGSTT